MSLLSAQEPHVKRLSQVLTNHDCAIDASETGTGKTYVAAYLAKSLGLTPLVICPLAVIGSWKRAFDTFSVDYLGISNYESICAGTWYGYNAGTGIGTKSKCDLLAVKGKDYRWNLTQVTDKTLIIFDEVHRCKNALTRNSRLMLSTRETPAKKLLLSATIADKPHFFAGFALMLGLISTLDEFRLFIKKISVGGGPLGAAGKRPGLGLGQGQKQEAQAQLPMIGLHKIIFPEYGSRMRKTDFGNDFPSNQISADVYTMDEETTRQIQEQYDYIALVSREAQENEMAARCKLVEMLRARQKIESLKVKTMAELTSDYVADGNSVVIVVNFLDTMALLVDQLDKDHLLKVKCLVRGGQSPEQRDRIIDDFQSDREHIIICQIQSGGVGISLHDTIGARPRVSIISPSWSAQDLVQALGRIHRAGGKTECIQKMVYCSGTVEDTVCKAVNRKIVNYLHLNDGGGAQT